ncbi:MAG: aminopeptidase P family protein [Deltaproteobacteria bacterium]|nr:aminopeptidase P family protein [Deltaproteobacteria bacterium]
MKRLCRVLLLASSLLIATGAAAHPGHANASSVGPEVAPELSAKELRQRRERLMKGIGSCAAAITSHGSAEEPDQDFYWLTGVSEGGAMLLLAPRERVFKQVLLLQPRDEEAEIVEGYREPLQHSLTLKYQVDMVARLRDPVPSRLSLAMRHTDCFATLRKAASGTHEVPAEELGMLLQSVDAKTVQQWQLLESMRTVKDEAELLRMRKAIAITVEGHRTAALNLKPGAVERQVAARIDESFAWHGATGLAFPSIVASGENGAILHWAKNDRVMRNDDIVIVDIGASYGHYASDLTRTYPVSGKFTDEQRKVYDVVLAAQEKAIAAVRPGVSLDDLYVIARDHIIASGHELKHYLGHFVGLDVHDVGDWSAPLQAGMVITIEPGIYLRGKLGVRIEDEVLVTAKGYELLSAALPRRPAEVEAWMARARAEAGAVVAP